MTNPTKAVSSSPFVLKPQEHPAVCTACGFDARETRYAEHECPTSGQERRAIIDERNEQ